MFVYNITYSVDDNIAEEWVQWQKDFHAKAILGTGYFYAHRFYELLEQNDTQSRTFVIQFLTRSIDDYNKYMLDCAKKLQEEAAKKWGNKYIAFRTLMKEM